jgi:hypothetical protein
MRVALLLIVASLCATAVAGSRADKKKREAKSDEDKGLTSIPLPIGHEAKGMVLPDFDSAGHMRGRFEANVVKRIDEGHVEFANLKMLTFTPEDKPDLEVNMTTSTLDLKTRILTSPQRTTVKRVDFEITGDAMRFDTNTREGTLTGNVKMVLLNQSALGGKKDE